jgi:hypothetical protein
MSGFGRMLRDARLSDGHYLLGLRTKSRRWAQVIDCMNILVERLRSLTLIVWMMKVTSQTNELRGSFHASVDNRCTRSIN